MRVPSGRGSVDRTPGLKVGYFSQVTEAHPGTHAMLAEVSSGPIYARRQDLDANSELTAAEFMLKQCREDFGIEGEGCRPKVWGMAAWHGGFASVR